MRNRKRNCYSLQRDAVRRSLRNATVGRERERQRIQNVSNIVYVSCVSLVRTLCTGCKLEPVYPTNHW